MREDVHVTAADLLAVPAGTDHRAGPARERQRRASATWRAWLRGNGCVPIFNLMEDAATCEISRTQIWQWIQHPRGMLQDGRKVTRELVHAVLDEELEKIRADIGAGGDSPGASSTWRATVFSEVATRAL